MANGTIDNLDIEISTSSGPAEKKLQGLINMMNEVKRASSSMTGFASIANSLKAIGEEASAAERKVDRLIQKFREVKNTRGFNMKQIFSNAGGSFNGWDAEQLMNMGQYEQLDRRLGVLMSKMEEAAARGNDLQALNYAQQANKIQAQLTALEDTANHTAKRFNNLRESIKKSADNSLVRGFKHLESAIKRVVLYRAIRSGLQYITSGFEEGFIAAYKYSQLVGGDLAQTLDRLTSAGATFKNQLGSAFAGLIQAVEPALLRIIDLGTTAANALSQMMAALGGKSYYKKATPQIKQFIESEKEATKATKELKRQIMGFDEINRLDSLDSVGTGNGSGIDTSEIANTFSYNEISDFWKKISNLFSNFKLSVKDVFFDWKNLNAEQIAEKAVGGLCGLLGGVTGFMLGGIPGAIVGTLTGVGIGLLIDSVVFNHDGILSRSEIADMMSGALYGLAGGAIGFFAGGPTGALIGASVGVGLFASLKTLDFVADGKYGKIIDQLATALTTFTGAAIGFTVGGPVGAALGAVVGIGLSGVINSLKFDITDPKYSQYKNGMSWFICGVLGLPTDEEWKEYGRNAIKWLADGFSDLLTELHNIIGGPLETLIEVDIPETFSALKDLGSKAVDWIRNGFSGFGTKLYSIIVQPFEDAVSGLKTWWGGISLSPFHISLPHLAVDWEQLGGESLIAKMFGFTAIPHLRVDWYAQGGFPEDGLFMANHGELVGRFSNGRTAVANNEQITAGIADAVYGAFMSAFSQTGGSGGSNQPVNIYLDGRQIAQTTTKYQNQFARASGI